MSTQIVNTAALTAYPVNNPKAQSAGVNRFQLYFHKLTAGSDQPATTDAYYPAYQSSLAYQGYLVSNATMINKVNGIVYGDASKAAARAALETIFTKAFVDALDSGATAYANTGTYTFTSDDGAYTTTVTGDGSTRLANAVDAANALYAVYAITPAMVSEVPVNFGKYLPAAALTTLAYVSDAQDFYQKGPGIAEDGAINSAMSQALLDDFFREVDAIAAGDLSHLAGCASRTPRSSFRSPPDSGCPRRRQPFPPRRRTPIETTRGAEKALPRWPAMSSGTSIETRWERCSSRCTTTKRRPTFRRRAKRRGSTRAAAATSMSTAA